MIFWIPAYSKMKSQRLILLRLEVSVRQIAKKNSSMVENWLISSMENLHRIWKNAIHILSTPKSIAAIMIRRRCWIKWSSILKQEKLGHIKNHKKFGFKIKNQLSKLIWDGSRHTWILKNWGATIKDGLLLLIKITKRKFKVCLIILNQYFNICHGETTCNKQRSNHQII